MSVILLTLHLLLAQVNPATPGPPPTQPPAAAKADAPATKGAPGRPEPAGAQAPAGIPAQGDAQSQVPLPPAPQINPGLFNFMAWVYFVGDPLVGNQNDLLGGVITWLKVMSLISLVGWLFAWLISGVKERLIAVGAWYDYVGIVGLALIPTNLLLRQMENMNRIGVHSIGSVPMLTALWIACVAMIAIWVEMSIWRTISRKGGMFDAIMLGLAHVVLVAGLGLGIWMQYEGYLLYMLIIFNQYIPSNTKMTWVDGLIYGLRMGFTFMGYVIFLRIAGQTIYEAVQCRGRRLFAIGRLSVHEANRRMWAPWVVITVFLLVLAFTHWFLQPPGVAEMGRLYVGTLTLLVSVLLTVMVTVLTPLSLPTDIQQQTIYTVVSKPVRRLEMVWGRMIGYMALVTMLIVLFGAVSLAYLKRTVGITMDQTVALAKKARAEGRLAEATLRSEQADQLYTRMTAREPIKGSLSFLDSRGIPHAMGIDVGQDTSSREPRSHIEGATPSAAIWSFGRVPDPFTPAGRMPRTLNRIIPVDQFLFEGTIEWDRDRMYQLEAQINADLEALKQPNLTPARSTQLDQKIARNRQELERITSDHDTKKRKADELDERATEAKTGGRQEEVDQLRMEVDKLHAPPVTVEMTFNVYRTTKGKIGEPVYAEITASNPYTGARFEGDIFPIREYYTNKVSLQPSLLAGSNGALRIEVRCLSPTQYLGMAESDLFLLPHAGSFGVNYMKGLFGIWLQAMVLTAIGVFAGTFLSWPVALLTTIFFFVAGQLAFGFLVNFTRQAVMGGGPFESLIRLLTHDNQMSELAPTAGVILAKTLDALVMPLMSMLIFIVPNFNSLDVTEQVANGFAVSWAKLGVNTLLALGYAIPFSVAGFYILKHREVAA